MSLFSMLLAIIFMLIASILFVAFGQLTVRELRKNPKTKESLGVELVSGWDILNVAQVLAIPRSWNKKLENSRFSFIRADAELLYQYTSKFDRVLAKIFWWTYFISGASGIVLVYIE